MFILNKNTVNLIDDIFWNMGFKTETQAEKVIIHIMFITFIIHLKFIILIISVILGSCRSWYNRSRVAGQARSYRPQFRPAMRAGWLSYTRNTYPDGSATAGPAVGQGTLIVEDDA